MIRRGGGRRPVKARMAGSGVADADPDHPLAGLSVQADAEVVETVGIVEARAADMEKAARGHGHDAAGHEP